MSGSFITPYLQEKSLHNYLNISPPPKYPGISLQIYFHIPAPCKISGAYPTFVS